MPEAWEYQQIPQLLWLSDWEGHTEPHREATAHPGPLEICSLCYMVLLPCPKYSYPKPLTHREMPLRGLTFFIHKTRPD